MRQMQRSDPGRADITYVDVIYTAVYCLNSYRKTIYFYCDARGAGAVRGSSYGYWKLLRVSVTKKKNFDLFSDFFLVKLNVGKV